MNNIATKILYVIAAIVTLAFFFIVYVYAGMWLYSNFGIGGCIGGMLFLSVPFGSTRKKE